MEKLRVLVLGDGLLGTEIVKQTGWDCVSRKKDGFDINDVESFPSYFTEIFDGVASKNKYDVIVNCIANTNTYSSNKDEHWNVNYVFVNNLINTCNKLGVKLVHISTDYVYSGSDQNSSEEDVPVHCNNWYGYTKLLSDGLVQLRSNDYLLCRCTHKPNPFPYEAAWTDQVGNFDYVDVISGLIIEMVNSNLIGVYNVGTGMKTMYDLALKTRSGIKPILSPEKTPKNVTMDITKMKKSLQKKDIPFFSIAIPAYGYNGKGREFLEYSFFIMESQTFKDFEVVISDHSTDDTIKNLCDDWSDRLDITYTRNDRGRGVISPNLNVAMSNCRGKWIKILFQDDFLYDTDSLKKTKDFINSNPDKQWIATKFCHSNDGINMYRDFYPTWVDDIWTGNNLIGCPSVITIKNENLLYFDETLNWLMDCEYYKRVYDIYGEPGILDEHTVVNRTNPDRLTNTIPPAQKQEEIERLKKSYRKRLDNVTLIALTSVKLSQTIKALEYSCRGIDFGCVKLVSDICPDNLPSFIKHEYCKKMSNIDEWNYAAIYELGKYVDTEFAILIHDDGFIVNPESWRDDFLNYDYIGAPWGIPNDSFSFRDINGDLIRVGNSVSLRSKRLIDLPVKLNLEWKPFHGFYNEDGYICVNYRHVYLEHGMKFADLDIAKYWGHETMIPEIVGIKPFCFHRHHGSNSIYPKF